MDYESPFLYQQLATGYLNPFKQFLVLLYSVSWGEFVLQAMILSNFVNFLTFHKIRLLQKKKKKKRKCSYPNVDNFQKIKLMLILMKINANSPK